MTQMPTDLMRGSQLMGSDVYGADNQKIGDIDEVLVDRQGRIHGLVVGVGGFLGIGQKDVTIPFDQVQWMLNQEVHASANNSGQRGTNTADTTVPSTATGGAGQPATTLAAQPQAPPARLERPESWAVQEQVERQREPARQELAVIPPPLPAPW